MAKITITRHDGTAQATQEIDAAELQAFIAAGWSEVPAPAPAAGEQSPWPKEPDVAIPDSGDASSSNRTAQTKGAHKPRKPKVK